jgi:chromosome segregation ATPase
MVKINQHNDPLPDKPVRERKPAAKTKKDKGGAFVSSATPISEKDSAVIAQELAARKLEEELTARIRQLESRLAEQELLLAQRSAELDAVKAHAAMAAGLENQLGDKDDLLNAKDIAFKQREENLNAQIVDLQNQLKAQQELTATREGELNATRELLNARYEERLQSQEISDRIAKETARLIAEQREAKLALAKVEMDEWHIIGRRNAWKRALGTVRRLFNKTPRNPEDQSLEEH